MNSNVVPEAISYVLPDLNSRGTVDGGGILGETNGPGTSISDAQSEGHD